MNKLTRLTIGITAIFFLLVIVLSLSVALAFGHGLGDLFYVMIIGFWTLTIAVIYLVTRKVNFSQWEGFSILIIVMMLLSVFYTVRLFTVDRGPEFSWDGHIFLSSAKADHKKQATEKFNNELARLNSITSKHADDFKSFYDKGLLLRHHGDWEKSIEEYKKAIKANPNFSDAYFECAYSYSNIEQYQKALEYYQKASDIDTSDQHIKDVIKNFKEFHHL